MSFRIRDTSISFQQEEQPIPVKKDKKDKKGKKGKKDDEKSELEYRPSTTPFSSGTSKGDGFQVRHDPSNQCDYF